MRVKCPNCSLSANVQITGSNRFSIELPSFMASTCPVLKERLQAKGSLKGAEMDCEHLNNAAADAVEDVRRGRR
ncbi:MULTISPECIES: hypothetical protein [unclassified Mesorhizobium]|uniref:hypothetical protein n=1 Tax=unclassified Mesorhizobium TaxID=325217 RepID=UPI000FCB2997|nr:MULTISPECIES: hypothetical protein [unclassified Mesorhizobium]RUY10098.1 hypothetical protein EOA25_09510 [Mesorhizobium sp. M2A.F.Ca.ET.040.01.1.1]TIV39597.1 MAG: hypothetical protein E5V99_04395 [Mesorhizobium sp.]TIV47634.1 MAG: hypothetical protein E5V96_02455 [Mesorhizobium sp.]